MSAVIAVALAVLLVILSGKTEGESAGVQKEYAKTLFDASTVHTIDILMGDWDSFIAGCEDEQYTACDVVVDGVTYKNVGIRAKGNTSLSNVSSLGSSRYSFKIEFDRYNDGQSCMGLDKLSLNNIIQDNTYMKDFLCYRLMNEFGVDSPLCSYSYISVNGEDWGLYLAVEGVEESFLERNYGSNYGELYKPDSSELGGGRGNGMDFDDQTDKTQQPQDRQNADERPQTPDNAQNGRQQPEDMQLPEMPDGEMPEMPSGEMPEMPDGEVPNGGMAKPDDSFSRGSDDVLLRYSDDDPDSYPNIFDNAKTDVTAADKSRLIESLKKLSANENIESAVNIDEVLRYFVVHNFVCNFDSYTGSMIHNYYLYESDGKLSMIPWDYNLAFGGFESGTGATELVNYPIDDPVSGTAKEDRPMLAWIFENEEYTGQYHEYMRQFIEQVFTSGKFEKLIDSTYELIAPYVEKDPTKFCTAEEFETGAATLKSFCLLRAQSISGQLTGSIASTKEAQQADGAGLIDASALRISDMGGMDNTMQGGADKAFPDGKSFSHGGFDGEDKKITAAPTASGGKLLLTVVPAAGLLAAGVVFAAGFKRRR